MLDSEDSCSQRVLPSLTTPTASGKTPTSAPSPAPSPSLKITATAMLEDAKTATEQLPNTGRSAALTSLPLPGDPQAREKNRKKKKMG